MRTIILLSLFLSAPLLAEFKPELKSFETDFCSRYYDGEKYKHCCYEHDKIYWIGGAYEDRLAADKQLKLCFQKSGYPATAYAAYWTVRLFGGPYFKTSYRWGYGWNYKRPYGELTDAEAIMVFEQIHAWEIETGQSWLEL